MRGQRQAVDVHSAVCLECEAEGLAIVRKCIPDFLAGGIRVRDVLPIDDVVALNPGAGAFVGLARFIERSSDFFERLQSFCVLQIAAQNGFMRSTNA